MGKTSFALSLAQNAATTGGWPCLVFSLEMSSTQLAERMLCSEARVDSSALRRGQLQRQDMTNLTYAAATLSKAPILIDDTPGPVAARAARARPPVPRRTRSCSPARSSASSWSTTSSSCAARRRRRRPRASRRSARSRAASRALAKELDCPVLALSQLNRSLEQRTDKRPQLSDLRESGAIEQDADVIMFIYRDVVYNKECREPEHRRGHHRQEPSRRDRHGRDPLRGSVHAVREPVPAQRHAAPQLRVGGVSGA